MNKISKHTTNNKQQKGKTQLTFGTTPAVILIGQADACAHLGEISLDNGLSENMT